jgi:hypothetical protein
MARETGLEPAASAVTGRRSNQLSYSRNPTDSSFRRVPSTLDKVATGIRQSLSRSILRFGRILCEFNGYADEATEPDATATHRPRANSIRWIACEKPLNGHAAFKAGDR